MSERYDRLFTTLTAPAVERVCSYDEGLARLETYVKMSCGILAHVRLHIDRDLSFVTCTAHRIARFTPIAFLEELERKDSETLRALAILEEFKQSLPSSLVWLNAARTFFSACAMHAIASAQACYDNGVEQLKVTRAFVRIAHQSTGAHRTGLENAIAYILNTDDRRRPEHAQALEFGLSLCLTDYFSVLCRSIQLHYLVAMQERDSARTPTMPELNDMMDFAAIHGVPSLETGDDELDCAFAESLRCVPMCLIMLGVFTTHWGNVPINAFLSVAALACALDCAPMGRRAFDLYRERADSAACPTDALLIAELEAVFPP